MREEGRACRRLKMRLPLEYKYFEGGRAFHALEGEVEDVGARGVAMVVDRRIETGQKLLVTIFLPFAENDSVPLPALSTPAVNYLPVLALADAVWCRREDQDKYKVGVKFVFPDHHHGQRLVQFLDNYQLDGSFLVMNDNPLEAGNA